MAKKHKIMWVTLSPKTEGGSRITLDKNEICSCKNMGDAQLILSLLRQYSIHGRHENKDAKPDERMSFLTME